MSSLFTSLFGWMPPMLALICSAVVFLFFIVSILHVISFILDLIPFI